MSLFKDKNDDDIIKILEKNINQFNPPELLSKLCKYGKTESVKWMYEYSGEYMTLHLCYNNNECIRNACKYGHLDIVRWLYPKNSWDIEIDRIFKDEFDVEDLLCFCCRYGYLDCVKLLVEIDKDLDLSEKDEEPMSLACQEGHIDILKYFTELRGDEINISIDNEKILRLSCYKNHNDVCKYLIENYKNIDISAYDEHPFRIACRNDNIEFVKYLLELKPSIIENQYINEILADCIIECNINIVKHLMTLLPDPDFSLTFDSEYTEEQLDVMKWLLDYKPYFYNPCDISNFSFVCACGNLDLTQYFYEKNTLALKDYEEAFEHSIINGFVSTCEWLLKKQPGVRCIRNMKNILFTTCDSNYLEISKWIMENFSNTDISYDDDCIFKNICERNQYYEDNIELVRWFISLKPGYFKISTHNNGYLETITDFLVERILKISGKKYAKKIEICIICQDKDSDSVTCCNHQYCKVCISKWYKRNTNCPYCRQQNIKLFEFFLKN